jgi:hypothetical protein
MRVEQRYLPPEIYQHDFGELSRLSHLKQQHRWVHKKGNILDKLLN